MKDAPESFDRLIRSKLDDINVDPLLADKYWQDCKLTSGKPTGTGRFLSNYWFSASVIVVLFFVLLFFRANKNSVVSNQKMDGRDQRKSLKLSTNEDSLMVSKKVVYNKQPQSETLPVNNESLVKPKADKAAYERNKQLDKPKEDTTLFHQSMDATNSFNSFNKIDSLINAGKEVKESEIKPAEMALKKVDSSHKKTNERKKAPYIIW